ncbi:MULTISPECIES: helix-turn-helix domain-containing protein [Streptomyces]|nr:helix-turn-helix transcriptional regulator [Streptomyces nigrescens]MEE4423094.1 helix-turn-helix transcriptional regulator [Streptomyces sp. DSM 41528]
MTRTGGTGGAGPAAAHDPAALVALMQHLKEDSGLTYRQLERRAAERGGVLARSTLADVLNRKSLPRAEVLAAFLRACGRPEDEVGEWLAARRRIEEGTAAPPAPAPEPAPASGAAPAPGPPSDAARRPAPRRRLLTGAALLGTVVLAVGVPLLAGDGGAEPGASAATPPAGEVRIRPLRAPGLCLTDGRVLRAHAYHTVAVVRPCAQAVPPHTRLTAAGDGRHLVQWSHPDEGTGCLVLLRAPGLAGLLEPQNDCTAGGPAQRFRIEPVDARTDGGRRAYRLRLTDGDRCVGLSGRAAGATAVSAPCRTGADDQTFVIGPG